MSSNASSQLPGTRLEQYSLKHPQEVLLVDAEVKGEPDQVMVFRGFSSSLMNATNFDPDVPVLPIDAEIVAIARLQGPYQPNNPQVIEADLTWEAFLPRLEAEGL